MRDRRRRDAEVHLLGAGVAHHLHDLEGGGAAHDGVVDQHDALAVDHGAVALCFNRTPSWRMCWVGSMKVRPT